MVIFFGAHKPQIVILDAAGSVPRYNSYDLSEQCVPNAYHSPGPGPVDPRQSTDRGCVGDGAEPASSAHLWITDIAVNASTVRDLHTLLSGRNACERRKTSLK
jgi:hypothetical protein